MADLKTKQGNSGIFETVAKWSQGEGKPMAERKGTFTMAHSPATLVAWLGTLAPGLDDAGQSNMTPSISADGAVGVPTLGYAFECLLYGLDLKTKARLRPAAGADSPWIGRERPDGVNVKINLFTGEQLNAKTGEKMATLPVERCVGAVNAGIDAAVQIGAEPQGAYLTAKRMLIEAKKAKEEKGILVVVK